MSVGCFMGFAIDNNRLILIFISLFLAMLTLVILKKYNPSTKLKISLIYTHLSFLFFPFVLYSINVGCGVFCMSCYENLLRLAVYALPTTLIASTLAGFVLIPTLYIFSNKRREIKSKWIIDFVRKHSEKLNVKTPRLYAVDKANPVAFSFRSFKSAIFLSIGLLDVLNRKEIKAVLLHELAHIKQKSSILKLSNSFLRIFSPLSLLARFNHDSNQEEIRADNFVLRTQKTGKYLLSAKRKLNRYRHSENRGL